jgi:hypothetical protein
MPVMLWVALQGLHYAGISENWPMVEVMTVWGYAMFVWIPVSVRDIVSAFAVPFFKLRLFRSSAFYPSPFFAGFYPV